MITVFIFVASLGFIGKFIDGMIAVIDKRKKRMPEKKRVPTFLLETFCYTRESLKAKNYLCPLPPVLATSSFIFSPPML